MSNSTPMSSQGATTRTATPTSQGGSRTMEVRPQPVLRLSAPSGVLRLRAEPTERRRIQWAEDVVDNEGMGKKSSKVCCIYHKPRAADESSDDESSGSSSDSDSDSEVDNSTARPSSGAGGHRGRAHKHDHGDCEHGHNHGEGSGKPQKRRQRRKPSPNAYEKMPKVKK
ncbi:type 1 phosphatase regulator YPI1 [Parastagonospora nodorum]|nr:type 1 phosphatase regulator YPI1 [Parastagonospora nodorum]KAH4085168.1 type 1 phosphatase regulator YPI1 [Parastagonospora nodorum]KAH4176191.1 type 1 phosphatase regulator YPI1 [Parastagonospora nodorum]KAH4195751.1 type 1 phosphatase regulator YPI1 [Parastagonospora nodorum]KAH4220906.1 type 1 phosphatase regulator YPI1 [Parastagonospora nodorum]